MPPPWAAAHCCGQCWGLSVLPRKEPWGLLTGCSPDLEMVSELCHGQKRASVPNGFGGRKESEWEAGRDGLL